MRRALRHFLRSRSGATAAEFALVVPLLIVLLIGIIDVGRAMWTWNRAEKATQVGVREAVATNMVPASLRTYSFVTSGGLPQGSPIPTSSFGGARCDNTTCTCKTGMTCPTLGYDSATFIHIVDRMKTVMGEIDYDNVEIDYDNSGLGFAGDPNGPDIAPLVTVRLVGLTFNPGILLGLDVNLPTFRAALTLEDGAGPHSN